MVNFVLKNKLLLTTLGCSLPNLIKPSTLPGYESYCTQDKLTIKIPYANEKTSELLNFSAGTCSGSGESSLIHTYAYNSTGQYGTFEILIDECGLDNNASTESDGEGGERESYSAVANITLGVTDNGRELVFYNALLGAACGETDDYTVTFTYSSDIDVNGDIECEVDDDGNCIVPAYKRYSFEITEFESSSYQNEVTDETRQTIANELIYLKVSSSDLPGYKKFAIKSCQVQRGDETYEIFNPSEGVCSNDFIDLSFGYDVTYGNGGLQTEAMIQHKLFLLGNQNSDQVYSLSCEIKVCDRNNGTSECNEWSACLDAAGQEEYVCDAEMDSFCEADDENASCEVANNEGVCV